MSRAASHARSQAGADLKRPPGSPEREPGPRPRAPTMLPALAFAALAVLAPQDANAPPAAPAQRVEAFVLEQVDPLAAGDLWTLLGAPPRTPYGEAATPPEELGFLQWRRSEDGTARTLEWDLLFNESETRLLEVERRDAASP